MRQKKRGRRRRERRIKDGYDSIGDSVPEVSTIDRADISPRQATRGLKHHMYPLINNISREEGGREEKIEGVRGRKGREEKGEQRWIYQGYVSKTISHSRAATPSGLPHGNRSKSAALPNIAIAAPLPNRAGRAGPSR